MESGLLCTAFGFRQAHARADSATCAHCSSIAPYSSMCLPVIDADDAGRVREGLHRAGSHSEIVMSSVSLWKTTCTGMSHLTTFGSAATFTRFDIMRGPSSSSIIASTYGVGIFNALLNDWWPMP